MFQSLIHIFLPIFNLLCFSEFYSISYNIFWALMTAYPNDHPSVKRTKKYLDYLQCSTYTINKFKGFPELLDFEN